MISKDFILGYGAGKANGGGFTPTGTINITANGETDVTEFATANVAVPASAVTSGTIVITTTGTHDVTQYRYATVTDPAPQYTATVRLINNSSWPITARYSREYGSYVYVTQGLQAGAQTTFVLGTTPPDDDNHCFTSLLMEVYVATRNKALAASGSGFGNGVKTWSYPQAAYGIVVQADGMVGTTSITITDAPSA